MTRIFSYSPIIVLILSFISYSSASSSQYLDFPRAPRVKRQFNLKDKFATRKSGNEADELKEEGLEGKDVKCNFGQGDSVNHCGWKHGTNGSFDFKASNGDNSNWIGGPPRDDTEKNTKGGYAFFETSQLPDRNALSNQGSALLTSPTIKGTKAEGYCISFSYFIEGLSADSLRLILHPVIKVPKDDVKVTNSNTTEDSTPSAEEFIDIIDSNYNKVIQVQRDNTQGRWKSVKVLYSFPERHKIAFEAVPKDEADQGRRFRGYIALDNISFLPGDKCSGHCSFDAGLCEFQNSKSGDFNWMVSRGSSNPNTGPIRDHSSFSSNKVTGSFAVIDSGYPRRPGDKAHLMSKDFPPTSRNEPHCLRFWTHMYGSGIGELSVYLIIQDKWNKVWSLSGDAGNNWYMGQTPISANTPYKILFEGIVGQNELGNIGIDDVSITPGICPIFPQVAGAQDGDCTFEDDTCNWRNPEQSGSIDDELEWERVEAEFSSGSPSKDHTTGAHRGYFISLSRKGVQKAGDRAHFESNEMKASSQPLCMSFWYFMYEPIVDKSGPNLGKLSVFIKHYDSDGNVKMIPIWRLHNGQGPSWEYGQAEIESEMDFQVVIEGVWGNNRVSGYIALDDITFYQGTCDPLPMRAALIKAECTFDRDSCGWSNSSTGDFEWRLATLARRPANLPDKSFGSPVGYAYFDIFNTGSKTNSVTMTSPSIRKKESNSDEICFSFWYAAFGAGDTTSLRVYQRMDVKPDKKPEESKDEDNEEGKPIWSISAADLNTARPEWMSGQVALKVTGDFKIVFVGKASNGGFAIDHLTFAPGPCSIRPETADPNSKN